MLASGSSSLLCFGKWLTNVPLLCGPEKQSQRGSVKLVQFRWHVTGRKISFRSSLWKRERIESLFSNDTAVGNGIQWKLFSTLIFFKTLNNNFCSQHLVLLWWWFPFGSKLLNWFMVQGPVPDMNDVCTQGLGGRASSSLIRTVRIWHSFLTRKEEMLKSWEKRKIIHNNSKGNEHFTLSDWILYLPNLYFDFDLLKIFPNVFSSQITNLSKGNAISNARKEILGMPENPNDPTTPQLFFSHWAVQGCEDSVQGQLPVKMWGRLETGVCPWHGSGGQAGAGCSHKGQNPHSPPLWPPTPWGR